MKKIMLLLTAAALAAGANAQKPEKVDVDYQMSRYPLTLISKDNVVDIEISSSYQELIDARKAEVQAIKDEKASRGTGERVARVLVGISDDKKPEDVFIPTLVGEESVSAIKVPGYTESKEAKGKITLVFSPMEISGETSASFLYKPLKSSIVITNDKGNKCYEGVLGETNSSITYSKGSFENRQEAYRKAEDRAKTESFKIINGYLAQNYGYTQVNSRRRFYDVKDKKQQYPEYHKAIEKVKVAFAYFSVPSKKEVKETSLKEAIGIWEEALKELNKSDKKARINSEVGAVTYINLAEAYLCLHEFDKAREALVECGLLSKKYGKAAILVRSFLEDYVKRYETYMSY
jgi:tetratricopeptide (TPR) repeat protein